MKPVVKKISQDDLLFKFTIENINVSLANAIRRTILADIPIIVFRTTPHKENRANIKINTTIKPTGVCKKLFSLAKIIIPNQIGIATAKMG